MAEMKLERPYMELHSGSEIAFGGYPIHMPSLVVTEVEGLKETPKPDDEVLAKLSDILALLISLSDRLGQIEYLLERWERPWYVRFREWLFRS